MRNICLLATSCIALLLTPGCAPQPAEETTSTEEQPMVHGEEHADHNPRHGGIFFMVQDMKHHLEGTLSEDGEFRVYLYDARTRPLPREEMEEASGTIHRGLVPNPPGIPLELSAEADYLYADVGDVELPIDLTLLLHLPGSGPDDKPEIFNFEFHDYSQEGANE